MSQAVEAYRSITALDEFRYLEVLRERARHDEASALAHAAKVEREKWQGVVAEKNAALADKDAALAEKNAAIAEKDAVIADKDTVIADKDAENEKLRQMIASLQANIKNQDQS